MSTRAFNRWCAFHSSEAHARFIASIRFTMEFSWKHHHATTCVFDSLGSMWMKSRLFGPNISRSWKHKSRVLTVDQMRDCVQIEQLMKWIIYVHAIYWIHAINKHYLVIFSVILKQLSFREEKVRHKNIQKWHLLDSRNKSIRPTRWVL